MTFDKISTFIRRHHVLTLATVGPDGHPWCAHAFYAWLPAPAPHTPGPPTSTPAPRTPPHTPCSGSADPTPATRSGSATSNYDLAASNSDFSGGFFVFSTGRDTRHGAEMSACAHVSAAIALETRTVGRVRGLQIEGRAHRLPNRVPDIASSLAPDNVSDPASSADIPDNVSTAARRAYLRRFPYAAAMPDLELWILTPSMMKLTDNTLGFGKKLIWPQ